MGGIDGFISSSEKVRALAEESSEIIWFGAISIRLVAKEWQKFAKNLTTIYIITLLSLEILIAGKFEKVSG